MKIRVVRGSTAVKARELADAISAANKQLKEHFGQHWNYLAEIDPKVLERPTREPQDRTHLKLGAGDAVLYFSDVKDDSRHVQGVLAYHLTNHRGVPCAFVFPDVAQQAGESWTVAFTHEILELVVDPGVNLLVPAPHPDSPHPSVSEPRVLRPYEICDPVQGDSYLIDGVSVSNFVLPHYFTSGRGLEPCSFMGRKTQLSPFGVRPGGYFDYFDPRHCKAARVFGSHEARQATELKEWIIGPARRLSRHVMLGMDVGSWYPPGGMIAESWYPPGG